MMKTAQLILASASPRRSELLDQIGILYTLRPVDIDETPDNSESPEHYVIRISGAKSSEAKRNDRSGLPILAADTAVVADGRIMGKPADFDQSREMLLRLSGRTHRVYSGVSLRSDQHTIALSKTEVTFRPLTEQDIIGYWQTGEPSDKAGSYAIQGLGSLFITKISGSYSGVVGLPLFETASLLRNAGIMTRL